MKQLASWIVAASVALAPLASARAAEPAQPDAPYTPGSVWELTFIRMLPGMGDDYLGSLSTTWKKVMEEAKKQGLVVSYKILGAEAAGPDDWDLLLLVEFKNWAAFDGLDAKMRAIEAKIVGNRDQSRALMTKRVEVRKILGGKVAQELVLK